MQPATDVIYIERIDPETLSAHAIEQAPVLRLAFEDRQKARLRAQQDNGVTIGLKLPRGTVLRGGDIVRSGTGDLCRIAATAEQVSTVRCEDRQILARVAYHLGNRHVWVQVGDGWLRYLHDHVLDQMVNGMGVTASSEAVPFEPEAGAYAAEGHSHSHSLEKDFGPGKIHHNHD